MTKNLVRILKTLYEVFYKNVLLSISSINLRIFFKIVQIQIYLLNKELEKWQNEIKRLEKKLNNKNFIEKAPRKSSRRKQKIN